jgi:hypothetical protein
VTSGQATIPGNVNSTQDVGNPGLFPSGTPGVGLHFTEIMYDPRSTEPDWEWVEVFNNTGSVINFAATPYVFDDDDNAAYSAANVSSGAIANGAGAILFNASVADGITLSDMQAAWDPDGTRGINFIPVTASTAFNQTGDVLALWPSLNAYSTEAISSPTTGQTRTTANAVAVVAYDDETLDTSPPLPGVSGQWPTNNGNGSIHLLSFDNDKTVGESWALSTTIDGFSFSAAGIAGTIVIHPGGDLGTPGVFTVSANDDADFDNDNDVDGNDFLIWQRGVGVGASNATGDANASGTVDGADLTVWRSQFDSAAVGAAAAVPEPGSLLLASLGIAACALASRPRLR